MFSLLKPIHGGLAELVKEVEEHIKCTSLEAVSNLKGDNVSTNYLNDLKFSDR